jgi:ribosomal protein L40E
MSVYQNFLTVVNNKQVRCPSCGALNPAESTNCEDCESPLIAKAAMWQNVYEVLFSPVRGMCRVANTLPVMQGFLIVLLLGAMSALQSIYFLYLQFSFIADNAAIRTPAFNEQLKKLIAPTSFVPQVLTTTAFALISWFMFAASLFLVARLLYRSSPEFKNNFWSMLAIVGFGRLAELLIMLYTLIGFFNPSLFGLDAKLTALQVPNADGTGSTPAFTQVVPDNVVLVVVEAVINIGTLVWKIILMGIGVHYTTGLNWNRALLIVVIPALLFLFLLRIPF